MNIAAVKQDDEIWVSIFRDYLISNMGIVVSMKYGRPRVLKTYKNNRGYHCVDFMLNGNKIKKTVHRLVALIFVKNVDPLKNSVNHNLGDKNDNRASSLSWMTDSENTRHGVDNGLIHRGDKHYAALIDEMQARTIKSLKGQITQRKVADYFKIGKHVVSHIQRGYSWKHI